MNISLCMIVKNEAIHIGRFLQCIEKCKSIKEIHIVDTGSTDNTLQIIGDWSIRNINKRAPAFLYKFEWVDDFSKARNFAFSKGTCEWLMWLDADDMLTDETIEQIDSFVVPDNIKILMLKYQMSSDFDYHRERIVRRDVGLQWVEPVHECLAYGHILSCDMLTVNDISIIHSPIEKPDKGDRNLKILESQKELSPRSMYYYARELAAVERFAEAIEMLKKFLSTGKGWVEDNIGACYMMARCYHELDDKNAQIQAVLQSFGFDIPRPEGACIIGDVFFKNEEYCIASRWYKLATYIEYQVNWGFTNHAFQGSYAYLQLCVCHDRMGDQQTSCEYNEKAAALEPQNESVLFNQQYFKDIGLVK